MGRIVVLISGSGSNLQAILDGVREGVVPGEVVLVVSNRKGAYGLVRAQEAGVETLYFPLGAFRRAGGSRVGYDLALADRIAEVEPDLVVLAGWMHVLSGEFLERFPGRVINLHPALPGQFAGTHAIERAFKAYQRGAIQYSGCMMHWVVPEVDAGSVIVERVVPILPDDGLADFKARMQATEHEIIVEAIVRILDAN